jgi:hypothetical protein
MSRSAGSAAAAGAEFEFTPSQRLSWNAVGPHSTGLLRLPPMAQAAVPEDAARAANRMP